MRPDLTRSEKLEEKHKIYILEMSRKQERQAAASTLKRDGEDILVHRESSWWESTFDAFFSQQFLAMSSISV